MPTPDDPIYFHAVLRPNPPLPPIAHICLDIRASRRLGR